MKSTGHRLRPANVENGHGTPADGDNALDASTVLRSEGDGGGEGTDRGGKALSTRRRSADRWSAARWAMPDP